MFKVALSVLLYAAHSFLPVQADGVVTFANHVAFNTPGDRLVRDTDGVPLVGTNYLAQLYYGPADASPSSLNPVTFAPSRFRLATTTLPGTWLPGTRTLSGFFPGDRVTLQVRVWDGMVAPTYEGAAAINFSGTQHGVSETFAYWVPVLGGEPDSYIEEFRGFTLVPEPSITLLGMIGIVGLCFWRRCTKMRCVRHEQNCASCRYNSCASCLFR
jgi:hypothetical protein